MTPPDPTPLLQQADFVLASIERDSTARDLPVSQIFRQLAAWVRLVSGVVTPPATELADTLPAAPSAAEQWVANYLRCTPPHESALAIRWSQCGRGTHEHYLQLARETIVEWMADEERTRVD